MVVRTRGEPNTVIQSPPPHLARHPLVQDFVRRASGSLGSVPGQYTSWWRSIDQNARTRNPLGVAADPCSQHLFALAVDRIVESHNADVALARARAAGLVAVVTPFRDGLVVIHAQRLVAGTLARFGLCP
jgi:hypothetical protein